MSIALDLGTSNLRSLRREGNELVGRTIPAAMVPVADEPAVRELLTRAEIEFATGDGELILLGDDAVRHAAAFRTSPLRLLPGGALPAGDPPARQILATLVEGLLPESSMSGDRCGLVLPDATLCDRAGREFVSRLIWMRGYEPVLATATHAAALASLGDDGLTGLALSFGASGCSMGLTVRSQELVHTAVRGGTDAIDAERASAEGCCFHDALGHRYLDAGSVRSRREKLRESLVAPTSEFGRHVAVAYREALTSLLTAFAARIGALDTTALDTLLPFVCVGGGTRPAGFGELVQELMATIDLPFDVAPPRVMPADEFRIARGALIHAELETACAAAA